MNEKQNPFIEEYINENKEKLVKHQYQYLEDREFLKVFISANDVLSSLRNSAQVVFEYIFKTLQTSSSYNRTIIDVGWKTYQTFCRYNDVAEEVSEKTFYRARKELIEKRIIAETEITGIYFFNLNYFFNGDRLVVVKEYIRKNSNVRPLSKKEVDKLVESSVPVLSKEEQDRMELEKFEESERKRRKAIQEKSLAKIAEQKGKMSSVLVL
jgi:hypothetical protein